MKAQIGPEAATPRREPDDEEHDVGAEHLEDPTLWVPPGASPRVAQRGEGWEVIGEVTELTEGCVARNAASMRSDSSGSSNRPSAAC